MVISDKVSIILDSLNCDTLFNAEYNKKSVNKFGGK